MSLENLVVLMAALTAAVSSVAVWAPCSTATRRRGAPGSWPPSARPCAAACGPVRKREERIKTMTFMRQVVDRLQLMRTARRRRPRSSWRVPAGAPRTRWCATSSCGSPCPSRFGVGAWWLLYGLDLYKLDSTVKLLASMLAVMAGAYFPDVMVKNAALKRQDKIRKGLPDGLDLMVICAEAGLSLDATLRRVADELAEPRRSCPTSWA